MKLLNFWKKKFAIPTEYTCQTCKESLPLTEEFFETVKNFKYGYATTCKKCSVVIIKKKKKK